MISGFLRCFLLCIIGQVGAGWGERVLADGAVRRADGRAPSRRDRPNRRSSTGTARATKTRARIGRIGTRLGRYAAAACGSPSMNIRFRSRSCPSCFGSGARRSRNALRRRTTIRA